MKGSEEHKHDRKKAKLTLIEKRQRKKEKKFLKTHPASDARDVYQE